MTEVEQLTVESPKIVVDHGSAWIKAGLSNEATPRTLVGTENGKLVVYERSLSGTYVINNEKVLSLSSVKQFPITRGMIDDVGAIETIWRHAIFPGLHDHAETLSVVLIEQPIATVLQKIDLAEMMFEKFNVPSLCFLNQGVLSLFNHGLTTGISVDIGHDISTFVPIQDGDLVVESTNQMSFSGHSVNDVLYSLVHNESDQFFRTPPGKTYLQKIKEKHAYVALDYDGELSKVEPKTYTLPDGKTFKLGKELIMCSEVLFQPGVGRVYAFVPIHKATRNTVMCSLCPDYVKEKLYYNIVLSGGTCNLRNFEKRFTKELSAIISKDTKVRVLFQTSGDLGHSVWKGGALQASADSCAKLWIHKTNFDEYAPSSFIKMYCRHD